MGAGADGRPTAAARGEAVTCCGLLKVRHVSCRVSRPAESICRVQPEQSLKAAESADVHTRLTALLNAVGEEWGGAVPLVQARQASGIVCSLSIFAHVALLQVWLPKQRPVEDARGCRWLQAAEAPFLMCDPALLPLRKRSCELSFLKGQGLPGRVWATGASEVIQDSTFVSQNHYSHRSLCISEGLLETIGLPIYMRDKPGAEPIGVLEAVLASGQHASNGSSKAIEGRVRLALGGSASVLSSLCRALDDAGLSCSSDVAHHGFSTPTPKSEPQDTSMDEGSFHCGKARRSVSICRTSSRRVLAP